MAKLDLYRKKRDFKITSEPGPKEARSKSGNSYLIQKHDATRLHYDFRLELDGVLKSWAVTKGPSLNPGDKRLAVETEDHPLAYGSFEGIIPKGQYGGGTVMLWDSGTWEPEGDPRTGIKKGHLSFKLHGERLQGGWHLVRMHARPGEKRKNWLLIKQDDNEANEKNGDILLKKYMVSVKSGRSMEEIARGKSKIWNSNKNEKSEPAPLKTISAGKKSPMPDFIPPQLCVLEKEPPDGDSWLHEVKFDGYRLEAHKNGKRIKLFTRRGNDWTDKFPGIARAFAKLSAKTAILDGEAIVPGENGNGDFKLLQQVLSGDSDEEILYFAFDLLYLNGKDLRGLPLESRKELLKNLLSKQNAVHYSEHVIGNGHQLLEQSCGMHLEGVVSKLINSKYKSERAPDWVKSKCSNRQEFVIGGFTPPTHKSRGIGALFIGYNKGGELLYAGKVGTGWNEIEGRELYEKLAPNIIDKPAFASSVPRPSARNAKWVKPKLVMEIEFTEWTADGRLRHPAYLGLREDKPAIEVVKEMRNGKHNDESTEYAGIKISHPNKLLFPEEGITKGMLAEYYMDMAGLILPEITGRPLSLIRCPDGITKQCFFQRHLDTHIPDAVKLADVGKEQKYLIIEDIKGLISLVQMDVIEIHPWGAKAKNSDHPDRIIFDLDPAPDVKWKMVVKTAIEMKKQFDKLGFTSFVKTTGGKGLHIVIPLAAKHEWQQVKDFTQAIARNMEEEDPENYISKMSKAARKGKIFIDYLRNDKTATAVTAYSMRARKDAPVAMPVSWEELKKLPTSSYYNIKNAQKRLKKIPGRIWKKQHPAIQRPYKDCLKLSNN